MRTIRTYKYAMLRKLGFIALLLVVLCALPFVVWADKPPQALYEHVTTTAQLVHNGTCNVKTMNVAERRCLIFYNQSIDRVWVVLFDTDKNGQPRVTHVLLIDEIDKEVTAWCRQDVCV